MILYRLLDLYSLVVFGAVILSWIPAAQEHPIGRFITAATEPVLSRIRAVVPPIGGFDLSALILLFAIRLLQRFV